MGRRRQQYRWINRLSTPCGDDSAHANRCRIAHAELESAKHALTATTLADLYTISKYFDFRQRIIDLPQRDVPRWMIGSDDYVRDQELEHVARMNRILWDEIRDMEHKIAFLRTQLFKETYPRGAIRQDVKRQRRAQKRETQQMLCAARKEREIAKNEGVGL